MILNNNNTTPNNAANYTRRTQKSLEKNLKIKERIHIIIHIKSRIIAKNSITYRDLRRKDKLLSKKFNKEGLDGL